LIKTSDDCACNGRPVTDFGTIEEWRESGEALCEYQILDLLGQYLKLHYYESDMNSDAAKVESNEFSSLQLL